MYVKDTKIRVRYKETDQMGIVHHSNYYTWFEVGRTEFMRSLGLSYRAMEERGFMLPLTESHCQYKLGARYDDVVIVRTKMTGFSGVRVTMEYDVIREIDGNLVALGKTVHAITDKHLKPVNIKKLDRELYLLFLKCVEKNKN